MSENAIAEFEPLAKPLIFLLKLAWESRFRIPLIITVSLMVLDVRMQLDVNIQMRRFRTTRQQRPANGDQQASQQQRQEADNDSEASSDSWMTIVDEEEVGVVTPEPERQRH